MLYCWGTDAELETEILKYPLLSSRFWGEIRGDYFFTATAASPLLAPQKLWLVQGQRHFIQPKI